MSTPSTPLKTSLLRKPGVPRYLWSQLSAEVGSRITREGLPVVAIAIAGAGAPALALLAALYTLPSLVAGNLVGQIVDRHAARPLLVGSNVARAVILMAIPLLFLLHHLTLVLIAWVTALAALSSLVARVARHAYLPKLVGRDRLEEGNAWVGTAESLGETTGPGIMGLLIQTVGAPFAIAFDAASNLLAALLLTGLRDDGYRSASLEHVPTESLPRHVWHVWSRVLRHPILAPLLFNTGVGALAGGFFATLYELYVLKTLHLSPFLLGLLIATGGVGSLVGARLYQPMRRHLSMGRLMVLAAFCSAFLNMAVPTADGTLWFKVLCLFVAQFGGDLWATLFEIGASAVGQQVTPDRWLGRVHGTFRAMGGGAEVVGSLAAAPIALWIGVRGALWVAVAGMFLAAWFVLSPRIKQYEPTPSPGETEFDITFNS